MSDGRYDYTAHLHKFEVSYLEGTSKEMIKQEVMHHTYGEAEQFVKERDPRNIAIKSCKYIEYWGPSGKVDGERSGFVDNVID